MWAQRLRGEMERGSRFGQKGQVATLPSLHGILTYGDQRGRSVSTPVTRSQRVLRTLTFEMM